MIKTLIFAAALVLTAASFSAAPMLDANGKCVDKGKVVSLSNCMALANRCRDVTTKKIAQCGAPNTEAVPPKK